LQLDRLAEFEGVGVYYAATQMEAQACAGKPVVIVGGGNSAGQAALFMATCTDVHLVIRGQTLATSMSRYLIDEIERCPRIVVLPQTQVRALVGQDQLEGVEVVESRWQQTSILPVRGLFIFIGATPCTGWLAGQLAQDTHGCLPTGRAIRARAGLRHLLRPPGQDRRLHRGRPPYTGEVLSLDG